jgi:hypothetical protein
VHRQLLIATIGAATLTFAACSDSHPRQSSTQPVPTQISIAREPPVERKEVLIPNASVGRVTDSNALVAVVPGDGHIAVYLCDGDGQGQGGGLARWFRGSWDGVHEATLISGPFTLTVSRSDNTFRGTVIMAGGESLPFTASPAGNDTDGLYRVERHDPTTGEEIGTGDSIVFDGDVRGAMVPTVTRCTFRKRTVVLADGTAVEQVIQVCR